MLLLLENAPLREAADVVSQPWFTLYSFLSTWRSDIDMEAWAHSTKGLSSHPQVSRRDTICSSATAMVRLSGIRYLGL